MSDIRRLLFGAAGLALAVLAFMWASADTTVHAAPSGDDGDTREISNDVRYPADAQSLLIDEPSFSAAAADEVAAAAVGDQITWVALHDTGGYYYSKTFELRATDAVGEVWVAVGQGRDPDGDPDGILGLDFPAGDCRNDGVRNVVTNEQASYLLSEFTNNIKAIDEAWFGEPVFRDGDEGLLPRPSPEGKQVVLVDNVRDDNFYDTNNANSLPYIAGFFTSAMIDFHDRNVMSIDGYDWLHRTGADPAHAPSADPCINAPARPFLYEGVFAHEYQHLIHRDYDADELNWVNEGMSDLAIHLTGYGDPALHIDEKGNDNHILNYQGWASVAHPDWNPIPRPSGPENSLVQWEDQGPTEILADYGFAYSFMIYVLDHGYDQAFFTAWHHNPLNGIDGLNDTLATTMAADAKSGHGNGHGNRSDTFQSLFSDMTVGTLVDAHIDAGANVKGEKKRDLQTDHLNSTVFFSTNAYGTPGAPPWGTDYIPIGSGKDLGTLTFDGADQFIFPGGTDWTIDTAGYMSSPDAPGETTYADGTDSSIARTVTVPEGAATLTFEHYYQTELAWDFGFVQVLADDSFASLPCTGTTADHNPDADPFIAAHVPGYTGPTDDPSNPATAGTPGAPLVASCDLSAFAGQEVVIAFRLMTDGAVTFDGSHIRNVAINGTAVDSTPADISDWDNEQFFLPENLGFQLTLVGISNGSADQYGHVTRGGKVVVVHPHLQPGAMYNLSNHDRNDLKNSDQVYALVTGIPKNEGVSVYFPYSLTVNGQQRADGAGLP